VPRPDNAVTDLANAIVRVNTHEFPVQFNDTTTSFFKTMATMMPAAPPPRPARTCRVRSVPTKPAPAPN
jgi:hypothetical protein